MLRKTTFYNTEDVEYGVSELMKIEPKFVEAVSLSGVPKIRKTVNLEKKTAIWAGASGDPQNNAFVIF